MKLPQGYVDITLLALLLCLILSANSGSCDMNLAKRLCDYSYFDVMAADELVLLAT